MYKRHITLAGRTILIREVVSSKREKGTRAKKENPTPESVRKINTKIALRDLTAKLNHNFGAGDIHVTLTYDENHIPSREEAVKMLRRFKRNIRSWHKKQGTTFKAIDVNGSGRVHHHIAMTGTPLEVIQKYWPHGFVRLTPMDPEGEYSALAYYMLIENAIPAAEEKDPRKRKYCCTRSIITPESRSEEISMPLEDGEVKVPKAFKGYYISQDTFQVYEHPILGVTCVEYILVRYDDLPRQKKMYRGSPVKRERFYKEYPEEQLDMFDWEEWT